MHAISHAISLTTDVSGDVTAYTPGDVNGRIFQVQYVKDDFDDDSTITLTGAKTGVPILSITGMNASATHQVRRSIGAGVELVINGTFDDWDDADTPTGWITTATTGNAGITEVAPTEDHGGVGLGAANLWTDDNTAAEVIQNGMLTVGITYRITFDITNPGTTGSIYIASTTLIANSISGFGLKVYTFVAGGTGIKFAKYSLPDVTIDNVSIIEVSKHECVVLAGERIKCVVSSGGNKKNGALAIIVG